MAVGTNSQAFGFIGGQPNGNVQLVITENWDESDNSSSIVAELQLNAANYGTFHHSGTISVAGRTIISDGSDTSIYKPDASWGWFTVDRIDMGKFTHDNNGELTISISISHGGYNPNHFTLWDSAAFYYLASGNYSYTCHKNDTASKIAAMPSPVTTLGNFTLTMNRINPKYYHKVTFKYGDVVLGTSEGFGTSLTYPVPRSWLSHNVNTDSLPVTVSIQTYTDSTCSTNMGFPITATVTVNADSEMRPSVSDGYVTFTPKNEGVIADILGYVQGYSKLQTSFDTSKISLENTVGATLVETSIEFANVAYAGNPVVTGTIAQNGSLPVIVKATDSRGRSSAETLYINVMEYSIPTLSVSETYRSDIDGNADDDKRYIAVKAISTISSLNGQNSVTVKARVDGVTYTIANGERAIIGNNLIDPDSTYNVTFTATDRLGNVKDYTVQLSTRIWALNIRPNARGIAFGKSAEHDNTLQIPADWSLRIGDVTINATQLQRLLEMIT